MYIEDYNCIESLQRRIRPLEREQAAGDTASITQLQCSMPSCTVKQKVGHYMLYAEASDTPARACQLQRLTTISAARLCCEIQTVYKYKRVRQSSTFTCVQIQILDLKKKLESRMSDPRVIQDFRTNQINNCPANAQQNKT